MGAQIRMGGASTAHLSLPGRVYAHNLDMPVPYGGSSAPYPVGGLLVLNQVYAHKPTVVSGTLLPVVSSRSTVCQRLRG
ncbi:hypothetical protein SAMN05446935_5560 [Burkholderia sp. YR290]|jgi:hypothetical protein|nr:hypothetical protein SAMN05446934_4481 [Paraburkholderia hospita]SOE85099.1 hypothetical protein SAMN05446935_5560 [Burkholderia sp. YR290]